MIPSRFSEPSSGSVKVTRLIVEKTSARRLLHELNSRALRRIKRELPRVHKKTLVKERAFEE